MKSPWLVGKSSVDHESLVISFTASGALVLLVELAPVPKVLSCRRVVLEPSLTEKEKKNGYLDFLTSLKKKEYPRVALVWSEGMTYRQMTMPEMPSDDLEKAFAWDLKKKYYYNPDENYFGFSEVMAVEGAEGPEKLYNVFYCDKNATSARLSFVQDLGLEIRSLVPGPAALAAFAAQSEPTPESDLLICELDQAVVRILVARENKNMLVRQITLGPQESYFTEQVLGKIAEEIKKTVDFYEGQKYFRPVTKVLLTGHVEDAERVLEYLNKHLGIKVSMPALTSHISSGLEEEEKDLLQAQGGLFAAALGAVLMDDERMNLVPDDIKTKNRERRKQHWLNLALAGAGVAFFSVVAAMMVNTHLMNVQVKILEKQHNEIHEKKKIFDAVLEDEKVRRAAYKGTVYTPALLKEISFRTPATIALDEMQYSRAEGTVVLRGQIAEGQRESQKNLTQYAAALAESKFFTSARTSDSNQPSEDKALTFELICELKGLL